MPIRICSFKVSLHIPLNPSCCSAAQATCCCCCAQVDFPCVIAEFLWCVCAGTKEVHSRCDALNAYLICSCCSFMRPLLTQQHGC